MFRKFMEEYIVIGTNSTRIDYYFHHHGVLNDGNEMT